MALCSLRLVRYDHGVFLCQPCCLTFLNQFGVAEYNDLVDLIHRVESDFSFPEIINAYNDGVSMFFFLFYFLSFVAPYVV